MNNNNLYNTNNFIGITHNDYFKTASNALAKEIYLQASNCSNYSSNISNILDLRSSNFTSNYANITEINSSNYTKITSNNILARYDPMIETKSENVLLPTPTTLNHTYISNSNVLGEIRFWCKSTKDFIVVVPLGVPDYRVKIDVDGKLKVYYTYDPAINLTFGNGWVDVGNSIAALNASDANIGISLGGLEAQITYNFDFLDSKIIALLHGLMGARVITENTREIIEETLEEAAIANFADTTSINEIFNSLRNAFRDASFEYLSQATTLILLRISLNPATATFLGIGGVAFGFAVGFMQNIGYINTIASRVDEKIHSNIVMTSERRAEFITSNYIDNLNAYNDLCSNMSNLTLTQGFINTYNSNQQYISSLKCDTLNLNTGNIANINGIAANEIIAAGKIKQNNILLDDTYLTSNHLYNLAYNYTSERQYPSKLYNNILQKDTITLLGQLKYRTGFYLDNQSIAYGSGVYAID